MVAEISGDFCLLTGTKPVAGRRLLQRWKSFGLQVLRLIGFLKGSWGMAITFGSGRTGNNDSWLWDDEAKAPFSVALVKNLFRKDRYEYRSHKMKWESWVPIKVNILMWRIEMNRIPTRLALHHRHIFLTDLTCPLCEVVDESSCHVLADCGFSFCVWSSIWKWCKLDPIYVFDIDDLLHIHKNVKGPKWAKKVIRGIIMTTCWAIWNACNKKVFDEYNPKVAEVVVVVKSMSFLWHKSRSRFISLLWKDWVVFPLYLM
ncbi:RNA-directed DNA polymerase, eukaryota, Reverse transcriptase zinc-binding domain protein [Artemisia annua]|uniref:RNA-directed DNA polymerase, eukaryota, Reverse transcriptase zinc-binding domain protein n=1 Tax=Artemisia annua TaxID=35608 RepID=A0A2U1L5T4_ARTAN|nr:RNA-directed DNA polymerase, eukaryota, Reverse transcriptase zinc-binding domain protein [Artemisia annua]